MNDDLSAHYLQNVLKEFRKLKSLSEGALRQVERDEDFFHALDAESNSIAVVVRHVSGNMISRWTDFLTTDGEKPDRQRDGEFVVGEGASRSSLMERWEQGWRCLFDAVGELQPADLGRQVYIRGEAHSVIEAINRQLVHYGYHAGQIVFLAKHFRVENWKSLSIPRGQSEAYTAKPFKAGDEPTR